MFSYSSYSLVLVTRGEPVGTTLQGCELNPTRHVGLVQVVKPEGFVCVQLNCKSETEDTTGGGGLGVQNQQHHDR